MTETEEYLETPLHDWHMHHGGKMSCFGGYHMPLWYQKGVREEHLTVLLQAGMFDTSHMAVVMVSGKDSFDLLQYCFSKDLNACVGPKKRPLAPGKSVYGVFLAPHGYVIDDAIISQLDKDLFIICVNAGMGQSVSHHLEDEKEGREVAIVDYTGRLAKVDIQGPASARALATVLADPEKVFSRLTYFSCRGHFDPSSPLADKVRLVSGAPILLSRAGYTGEFGFEIFLTTDKVVDFWEEVLAKGEDLGLIPCGLACRDSLRAGAVLPLSHQDIGNWHFVNNPWQFALPYNDDGSGFTKDFIGADAILHSTSRLLTYPFAGFDPRKVDRGEHTKVADEKGKLLGTVLSCVTDVGIDRIDGRIVSMNQSDLPDGFRPRGLCCGFIKVRRALEIGERVFLQDARRKLSVEVVDDIRPNRSARRAMKEMV